MNRKQEKPCDILKANSSTLTGKTFHNFSSWNILDTILNQYLKIKTRKLSCCLLYLVSIKNQVGKTTEKRRKTKIRQQSQIRKFRIGPFTGCWTEFFSGQNCKRCYWL